MKVEEARAAVQASGELEAIEGPQFLVRADPETWSPIYVGGDGHPLAARVTVTRKGQSPREVFIVWDEYADELENDPEWNATRDRKPTAVFGGECERHAYRVVFADILAPLLAAESIAPATGDPWEPLGDGTRESALLADLVFATTEAEVDEVWARAKGHRTAGLERACRERKAAIRATVSDRVMLPPLRGRPVAKLSDETLEREQEALHSDILRAQREAQDSRPVPHPPSPDIPRLVDNVKPVSRKAQSRGARDPGRRGGGRS